MPGIQARASHPATVAGRRWRVHRPPLSRLPVSSGTLTGSEAATATGACALASGYSRPADSVLSMPMLDAAQLTAWTDRDPTSESRRAAVVEEAVTGTAEMLRMRRLPPPGEDYQLRRVAIEMIDSHRAGARRHLPDLEKATGVSR